jgi:hypothetical protein
MTLSYFQQPQVIRSSSPAQLKGGASSKEPDQRRIDDRKALDAAVSEGWPAPHHGNPVTDLMRQRSHRSGSQAWLRRSTMKSQP